MTDFDENLHAASFQTSICACKFSARSQRPKGRKVKGQNFKKLVEAILTLFQALCIGFTSFLVIKISLLITYYFIWYIGSIDIEDVERLLDEIGSLQESEPKNKGCENETENNNSVNQNNCNYSEVEISNDSENFEIIRKVSSILEVLLDRKLKLYHDKS